MVSIKLVLIAPTGNLTKAEENHLSCSHLFHVVSDALVGRKSLQIALLVADENYFVILCYAEIVIFSPCSPCTHDFITLPSYSLGLSILRNG